MNNSLAKNHSLASLFAFALPSMVVMIFLSLYTIVDGIFISRFVSTTALSATNIVYPIISLELGISIMIGTGGSAIISKQMGEGKEALAKSTFTALVILEFSIGVVLAILGNLFLDPLVLALGATEAQFQLCKDYSSLLLAFAPCFFLQTGFQLLFVTAGRPGLGLVVTVIAGILNMVLDYVFMVPFGIGITGAALATVIGYSFSAIVGVIHFSFFRKKSLLNFVKPHINRHDLLHTLSNGSSEMVANLSTAVTTYLLNLVFLDFFKEDGVAAITIALYFQFVFTSLFIGFSTGVAPIVGYKYGEKNAPQLHKLLQNSLVIIGSCTLLMYILSLAAIRLVLSVFTPAHSLVYDIALRGFPLFSLSFLLMPVNIFASAWFTALSNGKISALLSFARTFLFLVGSILLLPRFFHVPGAWAAISVAETAGIILSLYCLRKYKSHYQY